MPIEKKTGKLNKQEKQTIATRITQGIDDEQISKELNRSIDIIAKYREEVNIQLKINEIKRQDGTSKYELQARPVWSQFKKQFSAEELELILYHWSRMIAQFNDDITSTEEEAVLDLIRLEILIHRNLTAKSKDMAQIERLEKSLDYEMSKDQSLQDGNYILGLQSQITALRGAQRANTDEHMKLDSNKQKLAKDLKGTRDQRLRIIEDSKSQFKDLMALLEDERSRRKLGIEMAVRKEVAKKEYARLSEYHQYIDNTVDQPILNSDNVIKEDIDE